jgi:hypothetical protein
MLDDRRTRLILALLAALIGSLLWSIRASHSPSLQPGDATSIQPRNDDGLSAAPGRESHPTSTRQTRSSVTPIESVRSPGQPTPPGVFLLHVRDEHSGRDLRNVEIAFEAKPNPRRRPLPLLFSVSRPEQALRSTAPARSMHPGPDTRLVPLVENGTSPVRLEPADRRGVLWIRTPDHAWTALPVRDAREHWIYLRRACGVDLRVVAPAESEDITVRVLAGSSGSDADALVLEFSVEGPTTRLEGLPSGRLRIEAEGRASDGAPLRSESWSSRIEAGELRIAWIELASPSRTRFRIHCDATDTLAPPRSIEIFDSSAKSVAEWTLDELEFFDDEDGRYWVSPDLALTEGSHTALLLPLNQLEQVDVRWTTDLQDIDIEVRRAVEVRVSRIDKNTRESIHDARLLYQHEDGRTLGLLKDVWQELDLSEATVRLPEGACVIRTDDPRYVGVSHRVFIDRSRDAAVVELARAAFLRLELVTDRGRLLPAWDQLESLSVHETASGTGALGSPLLQWTSNGPVFYSVRVDAEGACRLHLDPLPDLVPRSTDLEVVLQRGSTTEHRLHFDPR